MPATPIPGLCHITPGGARIIASIAMSARARDPGVRCATRRTSVRIPTPMRRVGWGSTATVATRVRRRRSNVLSAMAAGSWITIPIRTTPAGVPRIAKTAMRDSLLKIVGRVIPGSRRWLIIPIRIPQGGGPLTVIPAMKVRLLRISARCVIRVGTIHRFTAESGRSTTSASRPSAAVTATISSSSPYLPKGVTTALVG